MRHPATVTGWAAVQKGEKIANYCEEGISPCMTGRPLLAMKVRSEERQEPFDQ